MTLKETADLLINRIGFRDDNTVTGLVISTPNLLTQSGRFFQSEHSAVTLQNIRDCQPVAKISDTAFNTYLEVLKRQCVVQVLSDTFERDVIDDKLLSYYPRAFDNAISLRMVVVVAELIMTSTRSNKIERLSDAFVGKLNYDVFRDAPNKFAIRGANYNYTLGIATRYGFEIESIRRRFGTQRNQLKTITKGQVINPNFYANLDENLYDEL